MATGPAAGADRVFLGDFGLGNTPCFGKELECVRALRQMIYLWLIYSRKYYVRTAMTLLLLWHCFDVF